MADRFGDCNSVLIESFKDIARNNNTKLSSANWLKVWKSWAKEKGHDENIELYKQLILIVLFSVTFDV